MLVNPYIYGGSNNLVTTLYTGTGSARSLVTGQNLAAGALVWGKNRDTTRSHQLFDTERGSDFALFSDKSFPQFNHGASVLTSFNTNGITLGSGTELNESGNDFVLWSFLKKSGFMDIVEYVGNTSGGGDQTIAHALGTTVGMMIIKSTTDNVPWAVYHKDLNGGTNPEDYYLQLNDTVAQASSTEVFHSAAPTSTNLYVGSTTLTNQLGYGYSAYLFAHNPAQKIFCGSFTTDGSGNATVTGLGFRPKWLIAKTTNGTSGWIILDTERGWGGGNDAQLRANSSDAEIPAGADYGAPTSDGFTWAVSASTTYIFMTIG